MVQWESEEGLKGRCEGVARALRGRCEGVAYIESTIFQDEY